MNIANKLTLSRIVLTPVFLALLYFDMPLRFLWALVVFIAASVTDIFDGKLARKYGVVTTFGKFLDPLADKILVMAAMVAFVGFGLAHPLAVIAVIAREFVVSGVRLVVVSESGEAVAANMWGKVKTVIQTVIIIAVMASYELGTVTGNVLIRDLTVAGSNIGMWIIAAVTVVSGIIYLKDNWAVVSRGR